MTSTTLPAPRVARRRVAREVRAGVHWGVAHGLPTLVLRRAADRGDLQAQLVLVGSRGTDEVFDLVEEIRARGPLYRSRLGYVTASHAAVRQVLTSDDFRTGLPTSDGALGRVVRWAAPTTLHPVEPPSLLVSEPPDHTRYRRLVTRVFTMRAVERLRERTEEIAAGLLDALEQRAADPVDLVERYCAQLPVTVIAEVLGVPEEERPRVLDFGSHAAPSLDLGLDYRRYRSVSRALRQFDAWLGDHLDRLRRAPGDDLLSELVAVRHEGEGLTETELKATAGLVLAAGFETTVNLLGNGIALLHDHAAERARVTADPSLWANVVEEALRLDPPVLLTGRMAVRDTEVGGQEVRAGSMVTAILGGANRDPAVFAEPLRFDVGRPNARDHIAFSAGRHHCLGAQLARMEGEVGLRAIWQRYPDLRLEPGGRRRETRILRGFERLPATLRP
ncbi:cytochrome P450 [Nocardioides xinjiangensis]|uniref:cytochrome P450 n=1 Tax=Nocardioides xinjiangensis TaxID=2817376 RepID=UPI001B3087D5|nr:cytochrome P450 [Nocardioides sp. SYSU D00778]